MDFYPCCSRINTSDQTFNLLFTQQSVRPQSLELCQVTCDSPPPPRLSPLLLLRSHGTFLYLHDKHLPLPLFLFSLDLTVLLCGPHWSSHSSSSLCCLLSLFSISFLLFYEIDASLCCIPLSCLISPLSLCILLTSDRVQVA